MKSAARAAKLADDAARKRAERAAKAQKKEAEKKRKRDAKQRCGRRKPERVDVGDAVVERAPAKYRARSKRELAENDRRECEAAKRAKLLTARDAEREARTNEHQPWRAAVPGVLRVPSNPDEERAEFKYFVRARLEEMPRSVLNAHDVSYEERRAWRWTPWAGCRTLNQVAEALGTSVSTINRLEGAALRGVSLSMSGVPSHLLDKEQDVVIRELVKERKASIRELEQKVSSRPRPQDRYLFQDTATTTRVSEQFVKYLGTLSGTDAVRKIEWDTGCELSITKTYDAPKKIHPNSMYHMAYAAARAEGIAPADAMRHATAALGDPVKPVEPPCVYDVIYSGPSSRWHNAILSAHREHAAQIFKGSDSIRSAQGMLMVASKVGGYGDFGAWKPGFDEEKFHMEERIKELKGEMDDLMALNNALRATSPYRLVSLCGALEGEFEVLLDWDARWTNKEVENWEEALTVVERVADPDWRDLPRIRRCQEYISEDRKWADEVARDAVVEAEHSARNLRRKKPKKREIPEAVWGPTYGWQATRGHQKAKRLYRDHPALRGGSRIYRKDTGTRAFGPWRQPRPVEAFVPCKEVEMSEPPLCRVRASQEYEPDDRTALALSAGQRVIVVQTEFDAAAEEDRLFALAGDGVSGYVPRKYLERVPG